MKIKKFETDLLFGVVSGFNDMHYLLADIDRGSKEDMLQRIGNICIEKHGLGTCYLVRSGKGWHIVNFTDILTLDRYVKILSDLGCDPKFIWWVKKVRYGVLRISRRSKHWKVPSLESVVVADDWKQENLIKKFSYLSLLDMEKSFNTVQRVDITYGVKDYMGIPSRKFASMIKKDIKKVQKSGIQRGRKNEKAN